MAMRVGRGHFLGTYVPLIEDGEKQNIIYEVSNRGIWGHK